MRARRLIEAREKADTLAADLAAAAYYPSLRPDVTDEVPFAENDTRDVSRRTTLAGIRPICSRNCSEEGVGAGDERGVVMEAEVASAFVVVEAELAFELAVVELDRPGSLASRASRSRLSSSPRLESQ